MCLKYASNVIQIWGNVREFHGILLEAWKYPGKTWSYEAWESEQQPGLEMRAVEFKVESCMMLPLEVMQSEMQTNLSALIVEKLKFAQLCF